MFCGDGLLGTGLNITEQHSISRPDSQQDLRSQLNRGGQVIEALCPFISGLLALTFLFYKSDFLVV